MEARTIHHQIVESGTDIDVVFELPGDLTLDCFLVEDEVGKYLSIEGEVNFVSSSLFQCIQGFQF